MTKKKSYLPHIIILIIILLIIWQQTKDTSLLPEIPEQLSHTTPQTTILPEQNAFVAIAGFSVLNTNEMIEKGYQGITKTNQQNQKTPFEFIIPLDLPKEQAIEVTYKLPCNLELNNFNCLDDIASQRALIQQQIQNSQQFIKNYLALQKYTKFAHILPPQTNTSVPYTYISSISHLLTAQAILDIKAGHIDKGMSFILADINFYRNLLDNQQRNLDDTVFAINNLSYHILIIDRLLHSGVDLKPYLPELKKLLKPLSDQERSLTGPLEYERNAQLINHVSLAHQYFYTGDNAINGCNNDSCAISRYFSRLLYKFNGTLNAIYLDWQPIINFAKQNYPFDDQYLTHLQSLQNIEKNRHSINNPRLYDRYGLFFLKNYAGEKQKNNLYYEEGYTNWFIKLYSLNNALIQLNQALAKVYPEY